MEWRWNVQGSDGLGWGLLLPRVGAVCEKRGGRRKEKNWKRRANLSPGAGPWEVNNNNGMGREGNPRTLLWLVFHREHPLRQSYEASV